jgi:lysozyme
LASAPARRPGRKTLAAVVGVAAATIILTQIPLEESGRTVQVHINRDGSADVRNVSGRQFLRAYLDIAGIPTACDGLTKNVRMGQRYSERQCATMLEAELIRTAEAVQACTPALTRSGWDYQRAAVVIFAYNIGNAGFCGSTAARRFTAGRRAAACDAFLPWNKAHVGGKLRPVYGLTKRRHREREVCITGIVAGATAQNLPERLRKWR